MDDKKAPKRPVLTQLALTARLARTALSSRLAAEGLYPGQDALLLLLGEEDGLALRDVAARLSVRAPTVTKTVARMSAQGLVEKRVTAGDSRHGFVHLTPKGEALLATVRAESRAAEREAMKGLKRKERRMLRKLLQTVERNIASGAGGEPANDEG